MEFSIGSFTFKVEREAKMRGDPSRMSKRAKRRLAKLILAQVARDGKIERIKVLRRIAIDSGCYDKFNFGLMAAKDWVEKVFADNGAGEIAL